MDIQTLDELRIVLNPTGQLALAVALMMLMLSVSLGLRGADFMRLLERRWLLIGGLITQLLALPALTYLLVLLLQPPPSVALGMFVVACCPGGVVSNYLTYLAGGNIAYSVSLTAASSALAAVSTPGMILALSHAYAPTAELLQRIEFDPVAFLVQTSILLGVPLLAGMLIVAHRPMFAARLRAVVAWLGSIALVAAIVIGGLQILPMLWPAMPMLVKTTALHNTAAFLLGMLAALALRADSGRRRALTFEVGIQNSGLAIVILLAQFQGLGGAAAMAVVWSLWHLFAGAIVVLAMRRFNF